MKRVGKDFKINKLDAHDDLWAQSDTLLLADVFNSFRNMCLEIYKLNSAYFCSAPGSATQTALK